VEVAKIKRSILLGLCILIIIAGYIRFAETDKYKKLRIDYLGGNNELLNKLESIGSMVHYVKSFQEFREDSDVYLIDGVEVNTLDRAAFLAFLKKHKKVYFLNLSSTKEISNKFMDGESYEIPGKNQDRTLLKLFYNDENKLTMTTQNYSDYKELYRIFIHTNR
jgi:hypothetical protein